MAVPQAQLMTDLSVKDRHTLYRVRDELIAAGLIETDKTQGRGSARYRITMLEQTAPQMATDKPRQGSFNTEDFFAAAVRKSFGD